MIRIGAASGPIINDLNYLDREPKKGVIGGAGLYATAGMSAVLDGAVFMGHAGADFSRRYRDVLHYNKIENAVVESMENTLYEILNYHENGSYGVDYKYPEHEKAEIYNDINPSLKEIEEAAPKLDGLYLIKRPSDLAFLLPAYEIAKKHNLKTIYEYAQGFHNEFVADFNSLCEIASHFSIFTINKNEIAQILNRDEEDYILDKLSEIKSQVIFFRVGERGAYIIAEGERYFVPSILADIENPEPTGCGNCSSGAILASYMLDDDPITMGAKANIAAYLNVLQTGPYIDRDGDIIEIVKRAASAYREELLYGKKDIFAKKLIKPSYFLQKFSVE